MRNLLQGKRVAILAADGVEKVELDRPRAALQQAGAETEVVSLKPGEIQARNHDLEPAGRFAVDRAVSDASVDDFGGRLDNHLGHRSIPSVVKESSSAGCGLYPPTGNTPRR